MIGSIWLTLMLGWLPLQDGPGAGISVEAAPPEVAPIDDGPLWRAIDSEAQLTAELENLVALYPRYVDLRLLQPDRDGPPLQLVVLGEREVGDPSKRPGLLVLPELGFSDLRPTSTLVGVVRRICRELNGEQSLSSLLERTTIYVVPAPLPGRLKPQDETAAPRLVDISRNFPSGWRPASNGVTGPYPLSEPECHALADFLYWRSNLAACLEVSTLAPTLRGSKTSLSPSEASYAAELTEALSDMGAEEPIVFGLDVLDAGAGSLRRYANRALGLWTFLEAPSNGAVAESFRSSEVLLAESSLISTHSLMARVVALAETLPRLEFGAFEVEPLGADLWRVDLPVQNAGGFTTGARYRPEPSARIRLELEGAEFAATMVRGAATDPFVPLAASGLRVDLGHLTGGESRVFRAIVRAPAGAELTFHLRAARAGTVAVRVVLPE